MLDLIRAKGMWSLLEAPASFKPLTAQQVSAVFKPKYSRTGNPKRVKETTNYGYFNRFLAEIEGELVPVVCTFNYLLICAFIAILTTGI